MTFEEWWDAGYSNQVDMDCARQAWDYQQQRIDELELISSKMEIPTGYVLVPIEPTKTMIFAGMQMNPQNTIKIYKVMIQAAQEEE